jgi:protein arginine N-methyltransferase 3
MSDTDSDTASSVGSIHEDASEPDATSFKDLFSDKEFSRVSDMIAHNKTEHGFDFSATIDALGSGTALHCQLLHLLHLHICALPIRDDH